MYFPYMRGKRHELSALRNVAPVLNSQAIVPVIEPVKASFNELSSSVQALNNHSITPHIIINPQVGELCTTSYAQIITNLTATNLQFFPCIVINSNSYSYAITIANQLINDGIRFSLYIQENVPINLTQLMHTSVLNIVKQTPNTPGPLLNQTPNLVILRDSFPNQSRNADYINVPVFYSDQHLTFNSTRQNQIGFSDFLTVGDSWSESGGPAYVVAIHLTYLDYTNNNHMYIKHCISNSNSNSPTDPGGKFLEALQHLMNFARTTPAVNQNTKGFQGFADYHSRQHYPGLGIVKELSMMHHLESLSDFL